MFRWRLFHNDRNPNDYGNFHLKNLTPAESILWKNLQNGRLDGKKFRRQHGIGPYILDFYCPELRLAVELDGASQMTTSGREEIQKRDEFLKHFNVRVIRFENRLVFENLEFVLDSIRLELRRAALEPPPE